MIFTTKDTMSSMAQNMVQILPFILVIIQETQNIQFLDDPLFVHATALIFALEYEEEVKKVNFIELNRISMIAKKDCILAHIGKDKDENKSIQYSAVTRCTVSWHKKDGVRKKNK